MNRASPATSHAHRLVRAWRWAVLALVVAISWLAFRRPDGDPGFAHADKLQHVLAFAVLALAARQPRWAPLPVGRTAGGLLAFGLAIELVQAWLPWREASLADVLADAVGIALGLLAARGLATRLGRPTAGPD